MYYICDTPIHKGQRGVTIATSFGTKIAVNAFVLEIMWLLTSEGFRCWPTQIRYFSLQGSNGRCHGNQYWPNMQRSYKKHKCHKFSSVEHINAMFGYAVAHPLSSVTFMRSTQPVEIFVNFSTAFGTVAIRWHSRKILRRSSQGNPSVRGFKCKRGS